MNIKLAYNFDLDAYKSLFPEIELFNWDNDRDTNIDLLVFPGGEDVSLDFYCDRRTIETYTPLCHTNRERDNYELNILDGCYDGRMKVKKILGVCRGLQFINVMNDGKLFPDMYSSGIGHDQIHEIRHVAKSNLSFMKTVNSLHHQGLREVGRYTRQGNRSNSTVIAIDDNYGVPEIVTWESERILGVQFHPEYYWENNPDKIKFREFCYNWVNKETTILI